MLAWRVVFGLDDVRTLITLRTILDPGIKSRPVLISVSVIYAHSGIWTCVVYTGM